MRLSLATRIFLGYAVVLATFGGVSLFAVSEMHQNQVEIRLVSDGYLHLSQDAAALETFHKNQEKDTQRLLEEKSVQTRRALIRLARLYFPELMARKLEDGRQRAEQALAFAPATETAFLRELAQSFADLRRRYAEYEQTADAVFTLLESESPPHPQVETQMAQLKQMEASLGRTIRVLHASLEARILARVSQAQQRERRTGVAIIALSVLAIVIGLLATYFSARTLKPVKTLIEAVSRIGRGDYSAQLGVRGDDEISVLAREFDKMARSLRERETQLEEKQKELLRAEQLAAIGRLSAQVAHEVRNPLSSIGLNMEMLEEQLSRAAFPSEQDAKESKELVASINREVDRLTESTEHYLKLGRMPSPSLAPEDVNRVLDGVLEFSREELERASVKIIRELDPAVPRALFDEGQLRQVFLNLLRNGREAMIGGGALTVRSRSVNGCVEVAFCDTGKGMSPEQKARAFEPFFSTKKGGTGLGLAVSRQILQAHGGSIECQSVPGEGTTFVVRLTRA